MQAQPATHGRACAAAASTVEQVVAVIPAHDAEVGSGDPFRVKQIHEAPVALGGHGIVGLPPSDEMRNRSAPIVLMQWAMAAASVNGHRGVMEQKTNSTRTCGRASARTCSSSRPGALS